MAGALILYFRILPAHGFSVDKFEVRASARALQKHAFKITVEMSLCILQFSALRKSKNVATL